jgi:hypothetical protein
VGEFGIAARMLEVLFEHRPKSGLIHLSRSLKSYRRPPA